MQIPREIYDTWKAVADKFKFLHQGTDDERREATKRGVQTIRARHGEDGKRWTCKSEHNTGWQSQSKDAIAYVEEGPIVTGRLARMEMFDMISGSSRETNAYPVHSHNHQETPPNDDAFILVPDDFDWLDTPVPPVPPTDHALEDRVAALELQVSTLEAHVSMLNDRVTALETSGGVSEAWVKSLVDQVVGSITVDTQINQALTSFLRHGHGSTSVVK